MPASKPRHEPDRDHTQARRLERAEPPSDAGAPALPAQEIEAAPIDEAQLALDEQRLASLTPRQLEVLILTARGLTASEIALELGCAERTVSRHRSDIAKRTGLSGKVETTLFACRMGLVQL